MDNAKCSQQNSCQLLHNCTKKLYFKRIAVGAQTWKSIKVSRNDVIQQAIQCHTSLLISGLW